MNQSWELRTKIPFASVGNREAIRRLFPFLRPYLFRGFLGVALAVPVGLMDSGVALLLQMYIDSAVDVAAERIDLSGMSYIPLLVILFGLVQSGLTFGVDYFTTWSVTKVANDLKLALFARLVETDAAVFDRNSSGMMSLRYAADADAATGGIIRGMKSFLQRTTRAAGLVAVLFYMSWQLAIFGIGMIGVGFLPLKRVRRKIRALVRESIAIGAAIGTNYTEAIHGNRTAAAYNLQRYQTSRIREGLDNVFRIGIKLVQRTNLLKFSMRMATALGLAVTMWIAGRLILSNRITIGEFSSFVATLMLLYGPLKDYGNVLTGLQTSLMAAERVAQILDHRPEIRSKPGAAALTGVRDAIRYDNVVFEYAPGTPVLKGVTFEAKVGRSVAFVGNSGGGKSTIANLLPRFYDVKSGAITIDGADVRDLELTSLRDCVAVVFQDNFIYNGTIRENIVMGRPGAGEEEIRAAARAACLDDFVASLELGLETEVGERGVALSGGQKQRVAIARAFLKDAPIVVLDEATSALDSRSEAVVQRAIENLMRDKTVLIIAHRLTTVINADAIMVVMNGEIVESGSHGELIARPDGVYASLYRTQLDAGPGREAGRAVDPAIADEGVPA